MKVLFVFSGNSKLFPISPFTKAQGESLEKRGLDVTYFPIVGKGLKYLDNVAPLRKQIKESSPDIIHAHYSLCGWIAVLAAGKTPVVLSLMGDDAQGAFTGQGKVDFKSRFFIILTWLIQPFLHAIIFKSHNLDKAIYLKKIAHLVPNGVRLDQFEISKKGFREELGLSPDKRYVLFLGNPEDPNKNVALVREGVRLLNRPDVELLEVFGITHPQVVQYLNSVDVFVLCSFGEGSPNVVKEAMSLNCPLVVTPAGDAAWVVGDTPGCHVASYDPIDFSQKLAQSLEFAATQKRTRGRDRMIELGLDAGSIAQKINTIYQNILKKG